MKIISIILFVVCFSCTRKNKSVKELIKIDTHWLDSIKEKSDTNWIKPYPNSEFVSAEYYVDRKDSIVTQLMKDGKDRIRQISVAKYDNIRLFFAEYYENGQMQAKLPLDKEGKYNGEAKYYYENCIIKSGGIFNHGLYVGEWKNFNEKGKLVSIDQYDSNGQLIKTISAQ